MNRHEFDSIWWKNTSLGSIGKPRIVPEKLWYRKKVASHTTPSWPVPRRAEEINGVHRCVRTADGLCFVLAAQARKLSLSSSLAEELLKRHARDRDGDAAIEVLSFSSVFWVDRLVLIALGRSSWWENWACDRHDRFLGATAAVRCAIWSVAVGVVVAPIASRWGSRLFASLVVVDNAQTAMYCLGDIGPVTTYRASWINTSTSDRFDPK